MVYSLHTEAGSSVYQRGVSVSKVLGLVACSV